jgi:hypothetical protein
MLNTMHSKSLEMLCAQVLRVFSVSIRASVFMGALVGGTVFAQGSIPSQPVSNAQDVGGASPNANSPVDRRTVSREQTADVEGQSLPLQPVVLSYGVPGGHVIVPEDTLIRLTTDQALSTKRSKAGAPVSFTVSEDVIVNHVLAIPRGATVHGEVLEAKKAGVVRGSPELVLELDTLDLGGKSYPLYAYQFKVVGTSKDKPLERDVVKGAYYGALAGRVVAGRTNALPTQEVEAEDMVGGAAAGAGAVTAVSIVGPRPVVAIPAESQMDFMLASPLSVLSVSQTDAKKLSQGLSSDAPVLYVRGATP